jgi:hypothetical protein
MHPIRSLHPYLPSSRSLECSNCPVSSSYFFYKDRPHITFSIFLTECKITPLRKFLPRSLLFVHLLPLHCRLASEKKKHFISFRFIFPVVTWGFNFHKFPIAFHFPIFQRFARDVLFKLCGIVSSTPSISTQCISSTDWILITYPHYFFSRISLSNPSPGLDPTNIRPLFLGHCPDSKYPSFFSFYKHHISGSSTFMDQPFDMNFHFYYTKYV